MDSLDGLGESEIINLDCKAPLKILEIGYGNGRMLLDMAQRFSCATVIGVAKDHGQHDLPTIAKLFDHNLELLERVTTTICDLNEGLIPIGSEETFDLIVSQCSIRYIKRKDILIQEIAKLLKVGGCAFIQIHLFGLVGKGGEEIASEIFFNSQKEVTCTYDDRTKFLFIKKEQLANLDLGLVLDEERSYVAPWSPIEKNYHNVGWTSIFKIKQ